MFGRSRTKRMFETEPEHNNDKCNSSSASRPVPDDQMASSSTTHLKCPLLVFS